MITARRPYAHTDTTATIPTLVLPTGITGLAISSEASSSAPAPGSTAFMAATSSCTLGSGADFITLASEAADSIALVFVGEALTMDSPDEALIAGSADVDLAMAMASAAVADSAVVTWEAVDFMAEVDFTAVVDSMAVVDTTVAEATVAGSTEGADPTLVEVTAAAGNTSD